MGPVSVSAPIDAPREEVFEFLSDLANRPAFTDHFLDEFRLERMESAGVGAAARMHLEDRGMWVETVIEEIEAPYRILERGHGGRWDRVPITTSWELTEGPAPDGCEVTVRFVTEPSHPLDRIRELGAERWYRRQWSRALSRLREIVESGGRPGRLEVAGGAHLPV